MLLKLLQIEQSEIINQPPNEKVLVLNDKKNYKLVFKQAIKRDYTYLFTSSKITLFKKFKKNIFDDTKFTDQLYLSSIGKIRLIDQWQKIFCLLYTKITKD